MKRVTPSAIKAACHQLGLTQSFDQTELVRAYRTHAMAHHPDRPGGNPERFLEIQQAYNLLRSIDPHLITQALSQPSPQPRWTPRPQPQSAPRAKPATQTKRDFRIQPTLAITPHEAIEGLARNIQLYDGRKLGLRLPPGLRAGETVRLAGQGENGADLLFNVMITPLSTEQGRLRVIGDDLWLDIHIPAQDLRNGCRMSISTPSGERQVWVPPGFDPDSHLRIKNHGLPRKGIRPRGHLYLTLKAAPNTGENPAVEQLNRFRRAWAENAAAAQAG